MFSRSLAEIFQRQLYLLAFYRSKLRTNYSAIFTVIESKLHVHARICGVSL